MKYTTIILALLILFSCKKEYIGQYPIDSQAPQCVINPIVENLQGRVKIKYTLPNETDILYVKAVYLNSQGKKETVKSSVFKNELEILGFGKSNKQSIKLITVDFSQNESEAVEVEIEPQDSPIYAIYESLKLYESWGGIKISWSNPTNEEIVLSVFGKNESDDLFVNFDNFYTSEKVGVASIRGLDTIPKDFYVTLRDVYKNQTDTLKMTLTPMFEIQLPGKEFELLPFAPGYRESPWTSGFQELWNGICGEGSFYLGLYEPKPYFTMDLGKLYKISRIKTWPSFQWCYRLHHPKVFELWGTDDEQAVQDPENWEGWNLIKVYKCKKPSGEESNKITSEDVAYAQSGEEYELPDECPPYRYLRFRTIETWGNSTGTTLTEMQIFGNKK